MEQTGLKVAPEAAAQEVERWLEYKKVGAGKREAYAGNIKQLADAISTGVLSLNEKFELVQELKFPIISDEGKINITQLVYKPRLSVGAVQAQMSGVKAGDGDGRVNAIAAALTGQLKAIIAKLDTEDYSVVNDIVLFFI